MTRQTGRGEARSDRQPVETDEIGGVKGIGYWYLGVFALALVVRLVYVVQIQATPLFEVLVGDARTYDAWAQEIAAGNWLGDESFYQAPFYPYFLAVLYKLFGHSLTMVRMVQILIGSCACVLVSAAGRRFFSIRVGVLAGILLALYPPAIFFDTLIQKAVLGMCFMAVLLFLLTTPAARARWWRFVLCGVVLGCFALVRENALILIPVVGLWCLYDPGRSGAWPQKTTRICLLAVGVAGVLLPVGLRNRVVGGEFFLTTAQFGSNFWIGNNIDANGVTAPMRARRDDADYERRDAFEIAEAEVGRELTAGEVSQFWLRRSLAYIGANPGHWCRLMVKKWLLVWNAGEVMDSEAIEAYQEASVLLRGLGWILHFGVLCPLAAVGVWSTRHEWRRLWLLYCVVLAIAACTAMFFVNARYRIPMVPPVVLFAAAGLFEVSGRLRRLQPASLAPCISLLVLTGLIANGPQSPQVAPEALTYSNVAAGLSAQGRVDEAVSYYEKALKANPVLETAYYGLGRVARRQGRLDEAVRHSRKAIELRPDYFIAHNSLGMALRAQGRIHEAIRHYDTAIRLYPRYVHAYYNLGNAYAALGEVDKQIHCYQQAIAIDPDYEQARYNLGVALAPLGELEDARQHLAVAVRLNPDNGNSRRYLASILVQLGELEEAARQYREAINVKPGDATLRSDLGRVLVALGRPREARRQFEAALQLAPNHTDARRQLARVLLHLKG